MEDFQRNILTEFFNRMGNEICEAVDEVVEHDRKQLAQLQAKLGMAVEGLKRASENMEVWQGYASDYFKDKHGAADDLKDIEDLLAEINNESTTNGQ